MDVDEALAFVSTTSLKSALKNFFIIGWPLAHTCMFMIGLQFFQAEPEFHCDNPGYEGGGNLTLPPSVYYEVGECAVTFHNGSVAAEESCTRYRYDLTETGITAVSEWNLVCDRSKHQYISMAVFFLGISVSSLGLNIVADRYGRRPLAIASALAVGLLSTIMSFDREIISFHILRFFLGFFIKALVMMDYVLMTEHFSPYDRSWALCYMQIMWVVGWLYLAAVVYFIRDMFLQHLALAVTSYFYIAYIWVLPESPHWLVTKGRYKEAEAILHEAARLNGLTDVPETLLSPERIMKGAVADRHYDYIDLVRTPIIRRHFVIILYLWIVNFSVYYFLSLNASNMAGAHSPMLNFVLNGLVEIPAYIAPVYFIKYLGRVRPAGVAHIIGGAGCFLIASLQPLVSRAGTADMIIALSVISKFSISMSFAILLLYTSELLPTVIRGMAIGIAAFLGDSTNFFVEYLLLMSRDHPAAPLVVVGAMSTLAGILFFFLPETLNKSLPCTIEDGENIRYAPKMPPPKPKKHSSDPDRRPLVVEDGRAAPDDVSIGTRDSPDVPLCTMSNI